MSGETGWMHGWPKSSLRCHILALYPATLWMHGGDRTSRLLLFLSLWSTHRHIYDDNFVLALSQKMLGWSYVNDRCKSYASFFGTIVFSPPLLQVPFSLNLHRFLDGFFGLPNPIGLQEYFSYHWNSEFVAISCYVSRYAHKKFTGNMSRRCPVKSRGNVGLLSTTTRPPFLWSSFWWKAMSTLVCARVRGERLLENK